MLRKRFLQMHATNNHSDIIFPLKFLLMVFLSDALGLVMGHFFVTEKPDSTAGGRAALQLPHSAFSRTALQTLYRSGQHLCFVVREQQLFIIYLKITSFKNY